MNSISSGNCYREYTECLNVDYSDSDTWVWWQKMVLLAVSSPRIEKKKEDGKTFKPQKIRADADSPIVHSVCKITANCLYIFLCRITNCLLAWLFQWFVLCRCFLRGFLSYISSLGCVLLPLDRFIIHSKLLLLLCPCRCEYTHYVSPSILVLRFLKHILYTIDFSDI